MSDLLDSLIGKSSQSGDPLDDVFAAERNARTYEEELDRRHADEIAYKARLLMQDGSATSIAQANNIGRKRGLPGLVVENNLDAFQNEERIARLKSLMRRYPAFGRYVQDGRSATIVADDHDSLERIAKSMEVWSKNPQSIRATPAPKASISTFAKGVYEAFRTGLAGLQSELDNLAPDSFFNNDTERAFFQRDRQLRVERAIGRQADATPEFKSSTASGLYSGASSLATMTPFVAASIAARSPAPAVAGMGLLTQTQAYAKYKARGASEAQALTGSTLEGGIEAVGEMLSMGVVVDRFGTGPIKKWIVEYLIKEGLTEQAQTVAQDAVDTAIANPDKTWGEYLRERPDAAYQTAIATLVGGTVIGGISEGSRVLSRGRERAAQAVSDSEMLDKVMASAEKSRLRQNDDAGFGNVLAEIASDAGVEHLYIPACAEFRYLVCEAWQ